MNNKYFSRFLTYIDNKYIKDKGSYIYKVLHFKKEDKVKDLEINPVYIDFIDNELEIVIEKK